MPHLPQVASEPPPIPALDYIVEVALTPEAGRDLSRLAADLTKACPNAGLFVRSNAGPWRPLTESYSEPADRLAVALRLLRVQNDVCFMPGRDQLRETLTAVERCSSSLGTIRTSTDFDAAELRQTKLQRAWEIAQCSAEIEVVAVRARSFDGRALFDAMLSLGFRWGDGDLFYWADCVTVSTRSAPGYFSPEAAAAGQLRPQSVIFTMGPLAVCPAPLVAYEAISSAANYTRQKLGGEITGANGSELHVESDKRDLAAISSELAALGLEPGSGAACSLIAS